ncbi:MAG: HigA family addiction module antidote protein [Saprospiraceae bacterium]|nr:HigA family addiction module antidote protein [Saprospiraceae bacterium]
MANFIVLDKNGHPLTTDITLHPGEVLAMEIEARGIKKSDFAAQLKIKPSQLSELLHQKRHVGAQMALRLEALLNIPADFWMRVQSAYDLAVERQKMKASAA